MSKQEFGETAMGMMPAVYGMINSDMAGKMEEFKGMLGPMKLEGFDQGASVPAPWSEFCRLRFEIPSKSDVFPNLEKNLRLYKVNYLVILSIIFVITILTTPSCLITLFLILVLWGAFWKKNEDPNWHVNIGGIEIDRWKRTLGMGVFTAILVIVFMGSAIWSVFMCSAGVAAVHGVFHRSQLPDIEEWEDENGDDVI